MTQARYAELTGDNGYQNNVKGTTGCYWIASDKMVCIKQAETKKACVIFSNVHNVENVHLEYNVNEDYFIITK